MNFLLRNLDFTKNASYLFKVLENPVLADTPENFKRLAGVETKNDVVFEVSKIDF